MSDWTAGYVADIGYTYGYYSELNPLRTRLALLNAGWAAPDLITDGAACELGFGQGVSINVHAAASGTTWLGTDFNPSQAAFAQELAGVSGVGGQGTRLFDEAFAEFCQRTDLPDFSFIGLHGIWSWISDENRAVIVDFVRRKLRVGGVLYISYNTQPGWAAMVPMRDLLTEHAQLMGAPGKGIVHRIDEAMAFANRLMESNPHYARANPQVADRLKRMQGMNRNYLAHEYFNRDWEPMSFAAMSRWLAPAKLGFACSANYMDQVPSLNFTEPQQALLKEQTDAVFRETVRDFMVNQQFRRDYWVKGGRTLPVADRTEALRGQRLMLVTPRTEVAMKVQAPVGEATLSSDIYPAVLDALADHQTVSVGQLHQRLLAQGGTGGKPRIGFVQLMEVLMVLAGKGDIVAVQDEAAVQRSRGTTQRLNRKLLHMARHSADVACLASPVSGGGVSLGRFQQLFLLAMLENQLPGQTPAPAALASYAWQVLVAQSQRLIKDGKPMESVDDNIAELTAQATAFLNTRLPVLRGLGLLD